ncbi:M1 family aminopeptidase [Candidatus Neomarinimicrobiota bacterium]
MRYLLVLALLIACNRNNSGDDISNPDYSHYDIRLQIEPDRQYIKVDGTLQYIVKDDSLDALILNLHNELQVSNFSVDGDNSFELDTSDAITRWLPNAMRIVHHGKRAFVKGDILDISYSYEGQITQWPSWSANVIGPEWIEMGSYFPWYPSFYGLFTYSLEVDLDPRYRVVAHGSDPGDSKKRIFVSERPIGDFIVCSSKDLEVIRTDINPHSFLIANAALSNPMVSMLQSEIEQYYHHFTKWFGDIDQQDMLLVLSKRENGGGYSRGGGLFLGGFSDSVYRDNRTDHVLYLSHEVAHQWWHGADNNWEDWLNEGFAEYSAMMLLRALYGDHEFASRLNAKQIEILNTPPIWNLDRNSPTAQSVLYNKSVIILNRFEEKIGTERFKYLLHERVAKNINKTTELLSLIEDREGTEIRDWFENQLRTR